MGILPSPAKAPGGYDKVQNKGINLTFAFQSLIGNEQSFLDKSKNR